jgi:uncharacterized zinc-type alcohol dehydrogenase-like protein
MPVTNRTSLRPLAQSVRWRHHDDPLMKQKMKAGDRVVGIIGLGGLGVMGVKIAKAMGRVVTVNSRTNSNGAIAKKIVADGIIASADAEDMASNAGKFDILLNSVPAYHDYAAYLPLLDRQSRIGKLVLLGVHEGLINLRLCLQRR